MLECIKKFRKLTINKLPIVRYLVSLGTINLAAEACSCKV